jgi:hypothetical protein
MSWNREPRGPRIRLSTAAQKAYEEQVGRLAEYFLIADLEAMLKKKLIDTIGHRLGLRSLGGSSEWRIDRYAFNSDGFAKRLAERADRLADDLLGALKINPDQVKLSAQDRKEILREASRTYADVLEARAIEWAREKAEQDFEVLLVPILEDKLKSSSPDILVDYEEEGY